jgi:O-methyltransferase involved in polyketide biosynthesis
MSETLLPLYGHPLFATLSDEQRWQLALHEAVHFFSLNIIGERELMTGLAQRIHRARPSYISTYLQHFLHEENAHTVVFARFCLDYGGVIHGSRQIELPRTYFPGEEEFLFFARVLVFEEIAQDYNQRIAADDGVWRLARQINEYHASDEARHIAFGRVLIDEMWDRLSPQWTDEQRKHIADYLVRYMATVCRSYVSPDVYRALGLPPALRDEILDSTHWRSLCEQSTRHVSQWLQKIGVFE